MTPVSELAARLKVSKGLVYVTRSKMRAGLRGGYEALPQAEEFPSEDSPAGARQVGGDHYTKLAIQPWEVIERNGMGFFDGNAVKYLMRFRDKGGVQDLEKARHYLDKLIELENGRNA